jgi:hypothetical protein
MMLYRVCQTILKILLIISCVVFRQEEAWGRISCFHKKEA